jgi:hypothetical protein
MELYETAEGTVILKRVIFVCTNRTARGIAKRIQDWLVDDHTDEAMIRRISDRLFFVHWPNTELIKGLPAMRVLHNSDFAERMAKRKG